MDDDASQLPFAPETLRDDAAALREAVISTRETLAANRERALEEREILAALRESAVLEREATADSRDAVAHRRDALAASRDQRAEQADGAAAARDAVAVRREREEQADLSSGLRDLLAQNRTSAAGDRSRAADDRESASGDRFLALADRVASEADRAAAADDRASTIFDELTGALRRGPGMFELRREVDRAHRLGQPFVLGYLDVDGLKRLNDSEGHAAGDELLRTVVTTVRAVLRPYDAIVRQGGDEFICGMAGLPLAEAHRRFAAVNVALGAGRRPRSVTVGVAELREAETLDTLIERADRELYRQRTALRLR